MLSRRHLRVKVLQALYAYLQSGNARLDQGENQLILSINKLFELFIYQLSFLIETARFAEKRLEENKNKHLPTSEDLDPNMRFANNSVLLALSNNRDFQKKEHLYKINWSDDQEMVRKFYIKIRETAEYEQYMSTTDNSFDADRKFLMFLVDRIFVDFDFLESFYEEKSIYFVDDYHLVSYLLIKFFKFMDSGFGEFDQLPTILKTETEDSNEDLAFVKQLFRKTIIQSEEWGKIIA
ncbi:MAG: hypothetical protein Q8T08_24345, partial [Ignavibacteria bacterium]|nr:hypothetical protein [Ignavibacteria bacterium]